MKRPILLALALMLVALAVAAQAPPPTQNQPPSAQAPLQPQQQPTAAPPQAPPNQRPKQADRLELRVERVSAKLTLTDDQKAKAKAIFKEEDEQNQAIRADQTLDQKQKMDKVKVVVAASREKFKGILTPDQLAKYEAKSGAASQPRPAAAAPASPAPAAPAPAAPAKPAS